MIRKSARAIAAVTIVLSIFGSSSSRAEVVCVKKQLRVKNGNVRLASAVSTKPGSSCPSTHKKLLDLGGRPSVYGDGSSGDLTVTDTQSFTGFNKQFRNITIREGATLAVPPGTVIRCSGTFTNMGTINGFFGPAGGRGAWESNLSFTNPSYAPALPGFSFLLPATGQFGASGTNLSGGSGGFASLNVIFDGVPLTRFTEGGSGGASNHFSQGGSGGALIQIRAGRSIINSGTIRANGSDGTGGAGGGGGGIVILASKNSILNSGTIEAKGGFGGDSFSGAAAGGGGGGGFIYFVSPSINLSGGTTDVSGGDAGATSTSVSAGYRSAGAGGGACGGNGGAGANLTGNAQSSPEAGFAGRVISESLDPTNIF